MPPVVPVLLASAENDELAQACHALRPLEVGEFEIGIVDRKLGED
jgi:hypothetical protein